ncbi:MAG: DUF4124 domain-containing protein [Pseudomonadota bacterium]
MDRGLITTLAAFLVVSTSAAGATPTGKYKWEDEDGNIVYSDKIPASEAEKDKAIVNDFGVTVETLDGKKSEAELRAEQERMAREEALLAQRRADQALLNTYLTIEEIMLHRDRRVELWQAQARVTELYLRNLEREHTRLLRQASGFQPYSNDPNAQMIDPDLMKRINETKATIDRHLQNLDDYKEEEQEIRARFDGDIARFKRLKGLE